MTKRKTRFGGIHEDPILRKKARKKTQAFGVPKTAAIKAIIKRNATESRLLRLPLEVRRRIWAFALGDRLLHIQQLDPWGLRFSGDMYSHSDSDSENEHAKWLTTCCISPYTETELFERSKQTVEELIDADEAELGQFTDKSRTALYHNEITTEDRKEMRRYDIEDTPHSCCRDLADDSAETREISREAGAFLPVRLLRVCRQIYTEASPIMWSTNTFSFVDAEDFKRFILDRTSGQKATLSKLRFDIDWSGGVRGSREWETHACQLGLIRSLRGLRSLSIYVEQDYAGVAKRLIFSNLPNFNLWQLSFDEISRYKILPLQSVNVVITNSKNIGENDKLSFADRVALAEEVRQTILDPEGAKKFEEEQSRVKEQNARRRDQRAPLLDTES